MFTPLAHTLETLYRLTMSCVTGPAKVAENASQLASVAELPKPKKYARYETLTEENLTPYHEISCFPITVNAENDMELVSDIITWGEKYLHHWENGMYVCSRCANPLYSSKDKYKGPCVWPSFRKAVTPTALESRVVYPYNKYTVTVKEVYCGNCQLFVGHEFEDAVQKGDTHPDAHWRQ